MGIRKIEEKTYFAKNFVFQFTVNHTKTSIFNI